MSKPITLEQRIVVALRDSIKSDAVAALIQEVEAAAQAADENATQAREEALDPAVVVDTAKVGAAVVTAELTRDRLRAALPRLQARHKELAEAEYVAAWMVDVKRVESLRDEMAEELERVYPAAVGQLVDLMVCIAGVDKEVSHINRHRPSGPDYPHLHAVERWVRGHLLQPDVPIATELRLPHLHRNGGPVLAWPLPEPSLAQQMAREMMENPRLFNPPGPGPEWWKTIEERDRLALEENRKQIAEAEQRQREFEERQRKELESAKERDRQAYRERGWPSG
jgi:hypothetical protein